MPARKPSALIQRHETAAETQARTERESALRPDRQLPVSAPASLHGHPVAESAWRRLMRVYSEIEGEIVTRMDMDLLLDYCILTEQVVELDKMRKAAYQVWKTLNEAFDQLGSPQEKLDAVVNLQVAMDKVIKLDGRVDRKRALLHQWRQSLYLTPRARAGAAPAKKEEEQPKDDLESLLDEVDQFVNGQNDR